MTPDHLTAVCTALYGEQWKAAAAIDLDVAYRTLLRWANGQFPIPAGIGAELAELARLRAALLTRLASELDATSAV